MIQRKLADKLGIQADHVESKKGSSPSRKQDIKNEGAADLKKTMDKSGSVQHLDTESLRSSPTFHIPKPGKPTTSDHVRTRAATPRRQSMEGSPNYMKSTSSFDARRECSQVSSQTPQNIMIRKSMSPMKSNESRLSSGSVNKTVGGLARTSGLKVARTLIKTPSFKPARISTKKYPPSALCKDFDVRKPTCSTTLKDSKMPMYLELSAGATESEGTSAMKVCSYTYCSLNGHHHAPLPPLKSFLSTKRRMLKAQKAIKVGCLSPRRAKPLRERMVKIDAKQVILAEIPPAKAMDSDSRPITPCLHEKQTDFFVEIYSKIGDDDTARGEVSESLSSTALGSVIEFEENLEAKKGQDVVADATVHSVPGAQEDDILDCLRAQCSKDENSQPISQYGPSDFKAPEVESEEGHYYEPGLNDVTNLKPKVTDIYSGLNVKSISISDDNTNNSYEDILADEVQVGFYDERSVSSGAWSDDGDSDLDGSYHNKDLEEPYSTCDGNCESVETQVRENSISHSFEEFQAKSAEKSTVPEASTDEKDGTCEPVETQITENLISHLTEEFHATSVAKSKVPGASDEIPRLNFQLGSDAIACSTDVEEVFDLQGGKAAKQELVCQSLYQDFVEQDQDETHKNCNAAFNNMEVFELDSTGESTSSDDVLESFHTKTENEDAGKEDHEEMISRNDATDEMEQKEPLSVESFDGIQTSNSLRESEQEKPIADPTEGVEIKEKLLAAQHSVGSLPFELLEEMPDSIAVNKDHSKQTHVTIPSETNQSHADETLLYESNGVENHEYPEIGQYQLHTYEFKTSKNSDDQMQSGPAVLRATPNQNQEADTVEGEKRTETDAEETSIIEKSSGTTLKGDYMSNANRTSNEEMSQISKHLSWTFGSRKPDAESEDVRDFNPREPNFLPEEPELEPEKVDLRHQLMDERKNSEEWMVDYALRQAVTRLAPARSKKVILLVEAFEKVLPAPS
ncbi:hypothetical protein DCAR_0623825 [Daucus carota subsp. sativus]|uniref:Calmodulin-binding domain-containing protein n=2 Tax=Daucus carota subsp. sativus TaxID=79200 RepID=A0A161ZRG7_DAUCS|nr:hypothetical protein DCAR_0623825 [Daucus carota subsp. sativus]